MSSNRPLELDEAVQDTPTVIASDASLGAEPAPCLDSAEEGSLIIGYHPVSPSNAEHDPAKQSPNDDSAVHVDATSSFDEVADHHMPYMAQSSTRQCTAVHIGRDYDQASMSPRSSPPPASSVRCAAGADSLEPVQMPARLHPNPLVADMIIASIVDSIADHTVYITAKMPQYGSIDKKALADSVCARLYSSGSATLIADVVVTATQIHLIQQQCHDLVKEHQRLSTLLGIIKDKVAAADADADAASTVPAPSKR